MRYRGRRPWGRREVPGRPALGRGSPSTTGARMQVQLWHAAEAALSPTPGRKNMLCPGPGTSRTNRPGRGWAGSQPPFLGPQESGKEGRQRASGREDHLDPAPGFRGRKEAECGREAGSRDAQGHTASPLASAEPASQPQHAHLEICVKDPDEGADSGVTGRLEHDEAPRAILSPEERGAGGGPCAARPRPTLDWGGSGKGAAGLGRARTGVPDATGYSPPPHLLWGARILLQQPVDVCTAPGAGRVPPSSPHLVCPGTPVVRG